MAKVPPRNPKYSAADLWPPGSKGNVDFPPAAFFPVYLGNFLCQQQGELVSRVQQYFASKGLLARMVFLRSSQNDPFRNYQDRTKLYDCLVYFTRELDALDAVKYLHRDKYHGHRLNIFPGRFPVVMNPHHSVVYTLPKLVMAMPLRFFEDHILSVTGSAVISAKRLSQKRIAVQYNGPAQQEKALRDYQYMSASPLTVELSQQQNYLEKDVIGEIQERILKKAFMVMCPEDHVLEALYAGTEPDVPMDWVKDALVFPSFDKPDEDHLFHNAETTLRNFGIACSFISKPSKFKSTKRVETFKINASRNARKYRNMYRKAIKQWFEAKLPWKTVFGEDDEAVNFEYLV